MSAWVLDSELSTCFTQQINFIGLKNYNSDEHYLTLPWCFLLCFLHFQITYKKVINSQIGVDKLVTNVSINLLLHTTFNTLWKVYYFMQSATCVIT